MTEHDPDALHQRIRELEASLARAEGELERLRGVASENGELKERVHALSNELLSLSPPRMPKFSFPVAGMSGRPSDPASSARAPTKAKGRINASQISLGVILLAVVLAWIPFVLSWLDTPEDDSLFTEERGIRVLAEPPPPEDVTPEPMQPDDDGASSPPPPDAGASAPTPVE